MAEEEGEVVVGVWGGSHKRRRRQGPREGHY